MTPAEIYQFESRVEAAIVAALKGDDAAAPIYERLDDEGDLPARHVSVEASPFSPASGQLAFSVQGEPFYCHYSGQVAVRIQSARDGTESAAWHHAMIGAVRALFSLTQGGLAVSPYEVLDLRESAGTLTMQRIGERDRSELHFDVELGIPGSAMDFIGVTPPLDEPDPDPDPGENLP